VAVTIDYSGQLFYTALQLRPATVTTQSNSTTAFQRQPGTNRGLLFSIFPSEFLDNAIAIYQCQFLLCLMHQQVAVVWVLIYYRGFHNIRLFNHPLILTEYLSLTLVPLGFIPEVNEVLNAFFSHALDMR
jgi:hypothetical protein